MNAQILINFGDNWFEFSKSKTGQIDYNGKLKTSDLPDVNDFQKLTSSTYFSPSAYIYLQKSLNYSSYIYVAPGIDISDKDIFDYLVHIGAILCAVEAKDSLLAGELFLSRRNTFEKFAQLTSYILNPLSVEILFSLCFGKMKNINPEEIPLIFNNAKKKLDFNSSAETLEQAFIRYFRKNTVSLTLPLVGTQFYDWDSSPEVLEKLTDNLGFENLLEKCEKIRSVKQNFYENLKVSVQAEPYNQYDKNSIVTCIENIDSKISGNPGFEKAGHIRALASKIIREAKQDKMNYNGKLVRLSYQETVLQLTI